MDTVTVLRKCASKAALQTPLPWMTDSDKLLQVKLMAHREVFELSS
jgi:hypothetical protein